MSPEDPHQQQFFQFCSQLQESAVHYSTLAMRQLQLGYQRNPGSSGSNQEGLPMYPTHCHQRHHHNQIPPVINVDDYDSGNNVGGLGFGTSVKRKKGVRKVNFAYPLSVVKMKSPTPVHSLEDISLYLAACNSQGVGGEWERAHSPDGRAPGTSEESDLEGGVLKDDYEYQFNFGPNPSGNSFASTSEDQAPRKRKKKRKKRKKKQVEMVNGNGDFVYSDDVEMEENYVSIDEDADDPFAAYEVPLKVDDYEFVSEIRLCTEEDFLKDLTESDNDEDSNSEKSGYEDCKAGVGTSDPEANAAAKHEMEQLYGELGSQRIDRMEQAIERHFQKSLKKT